MNVLSVELLKLLEEKDHVCLEYAMKMGQRISNRIANR